MHVNFGVGTYTHTDRHTHWYRCCEWKIPNHILFSCPKTQSILKSKKLRQKAGCTFVSSCLKAPGGSPNFSKFYEYTIIQIYTHNVFEPYHSCCQLFLHNNLILHPDWSSSRHSLGTNASENIQCWDNKRVSVYTLLRKRKIYRTITESKKAWKHYSSWGWTPVVWSGT